MQKCHWCYAKKKGEDHGAIEAVTENWGLLSAG